jgi:hypothetical protein
VIEMPELMTGPCVLQSLGAKIAARLLPWCQNGERSTATMGQICCCELRIRAILFTLEWSVLAPNLIVFIAWCWPRHYAELSGFPGNAATRRVPCQTSNFMLREY